MRRLILLDRAQDARIHEICQKQWMYIEKKNGSIENKLQKNETEHKLQLLTFFFFLFLFQFQIYFRHLFNYETRVQLQ